MLKEKETGARRMVRGTQKQMVVLQTRNSIYYEQAYFVLREGREYRGEASGSMMEEANRILDECALMPQPRVRRRLSRGLLFVLGILLGSGVLGTLWLLFGG